MKIEGNKSIKIEIPKDVKLILRTFYKLGYATFVVGGCVRDSLLKREINDWDLCTKATPEQMIMICNASGFKYIPTGLKHGTITIMINGEGYEVTTFRIDGEYDDNRHPTDVTFTTSLKEDLSRRDFTINAIAYNDDVGLVDYFGGLKDLENRIIKCVGKAEDRFNEDALRMLRCIRFASQLNFDMEQNTLDAIIDNDNIKDISKERIRTELCKILVSDNPLDGIAHLVQNGLNKYIIPELNECLCFNQHNIHHDKDIFQHILSVVENTPPILELRLSALLHDIGKPKCFTQGEDGQGHFLQHHKIGADMSREILTRLKFDNKTIDKVCLLVYEHMSRYDKLRTPNTKKFINRVGIDNLDDLFILQIADIKGCAKEYQNFDNVVKLKEECKRIINEKQPLNVKDLNINGKDLMKSGIKQGKEIGIILNQLLEIVLENPELNNKEMLIELIGNKVEKL